MSKPASFVSGDGLLLDAVLHEPTTGNGRAALLVHGITADMDEGGFFTAIAERLCDDGFTVLRFSFRGHGRSEGSQTGVTIAGEMLDVLAAVQQLTDLGHRHITIVAASFGAVAVSLVAPLLRETVDALVLLNPCLDLDKTFLSPTSGRDLNGFRPGPVLFTEMAAYDPLEAFIAALQPALIVHGDRDLVTPYEVSKDAAARKQDCRLLTVEGADHGFGDQQPQVTKAVVAWLAARADADVN